MDCARLVKDGIDLDRSWFPARSIRVGNSNKHRGSRYGNFDVRIRERFRSFLPSPSALGERGEGSYIQTILTRPDLRS